MIDTTILLMTGALEVGLLWGYTLRWLLDGRLMVLSFIEAIRGSA